MVHPTSSSAIYSVRNEYDGNGNVIYLGQAMPGTPTSQKGWQILKCTYNVNDDLETALWAGGTRSFDKTWNDRATYDYR